MKLYRGPVSKCLLAASIAFTAASLRAEILFEEDFNDQPDWTPVMHGSTDGTQRAATHVVPEGWYSIRHDPTWAPSTGHPDRHETIEILGSNADKARGGSGKSMVSYRDSHDPGWKRWNSESMMVKYFPEGYDQLYVEFWIRFDRNWTRKPISGKPDPTSKLFRISSWRGDGSEYQAFGGGDLGPIALWDYTVNSYGVRNRISLRGGPHGDNYGFDSGDISGLPRSLVGSGDLSMNFTADVKGMGVDGTDPRIEDRVNGGYIDLNSNSTITHDQIFGPGDSWTKIAIFVKMNSAPDAKDGVFRQWLNGEQIFNITTVPWIRSSASQDENAKWNLVAIGGNDFFQSYPNSERHEEWYSIDDVVIRNDIPQDLGGDLVDGVTAPPNPPSVQIQ
ncbi:hypothetical protein [Marinobacter salsuginis]|uniref:hypothetical protein n=1 Tax=Marinobacter salsuginis TaxID=418719 RepID=UPI00273D2828|nr:hypothetical protein [Marinobacter salsuginis]